ncbi:lasso peptide biosynthesis B2 protein [Cohnella sp. 56]|uniref:lasso peptide biosynthesis B2 protein n=1 Tax=Cohnella sp. 56 TaxID=3113722 RepID=UPI0030E8678C
MMLQKKWKSFMRMSMEQKLLLVEAYLLLGWARLLKLLPFSKVAPWLGAAMAETSHILSTEHEQTIRRVSKAIHKMSPYTWWESQCLVKAVAAMIMLHRRGVDSTLYLGTAKDEDGRLIAHAWLRSGAYYLTGANEMNKFIVVGKFAHTVPEQRGRRRHQHE